MQTSSTNSKHKHSEIELNVCEIPWQFHDISLMVFGTPARVKCYSKSYGASSSVIVSDGGRNATPHDPKLKWNA